MGIIFLITKFNVYFNEVKHKPNGKKDLKINLGYCLNFC